MLAVGSGDSGQLLAILDEEHTNFPLPPDVYVVVHQKIEDLEQAKGKADSDRTRVLTSLSGPPMDAPAKAGRADSTAEAELERIKGVGDILNGRFVLEECLGFGGMGMVFKALDRRKQEASDRNPYIAIKVLNVQFRGHPKSLIALQREAKKAQKLAHPNIVTIYDFDRDGPTVYLTMELLSGRPLRQILREPDFKGLPYTEALPIITGIGKALAYAHERGFVHCDLKPANVFLTDSGEVKVIDFGIARVFRKPEEDVEATIFDAGTLGGMTPTYASAEMLEHRDPDPRDDIYALGCITYEILTGSHPFGRLPATQARSAEVKLQRPKNLGLRQWLALRKALAFDRERRTPTVPQFIQGITGQSRTVKYAAMAGVSAVIVALASVTVLVNNRSPSGSDHPVANDTLRAQLPAVAPSPVSVASVLAGVPCSALAATSREGGMLVQGYLPVHFSLDRLKEMLGGAAGGSNLTFDVHQISDDDCGVIDVFAPYWRSNREAGASASIRTEASNGELREGDPLVVDITTPAYESYVNIDYYVLGGGVVHLVPSPRAKDNQAPANYSATVGSLGNWVIAKPFGNELVVLLVSPVPLFDSLREEHESRADYLQAVGEQLKRIAGKYGSDRIAADFVQVTTRPRP